MKNNSAKLGILDWGIGGISIVKLLKEKGTFPVIYFSDTGVVPYGRMSRFELVARLNSVIDFLRSKGATHVVIGCNAASTAIEFLDSKDVKIEGIIESAVNLSAKMKPKNLAVIGGRRTVLSGIYRRELAKRGIKIKQRIAQNLSALIESGDISSDKLREEVRKILTPIKNSSHILLACTHYPAISDVLKDFVSSETKIIDPAGELLKKIEKWNLSGEGEDFFYTTGDAEKMKIAAKNAFDFVIKNVEKVKI
jgi:glutamate racemase